MRDNRHPLTITLPPPVAELVRDAAQAQRVTYPSMVSACIRLALMSGAPSILEPFGEPERMRKRTGPDEKEGADWIAKGPTPPAKGAQ